VVALVSKAMRQRASVRPRLSSQRWSRDVWLRGGKCARQALGELLQILGHAGLIALDGQEEVAAPLLHDNASGLGLRVQGIGSDQRAFQLGAAQQVLRGRDFIGA
jgi:hypothetical protein